MNHDQCQVYNELKHFLASSRHSRYQQNTPSSAFEPDLLWDASRFWAEALLVAKHVCLDRSIEHLTAFSATYARETGINVSITDLLQEHWLRNVTGSVAIAHGVSSILYTFDKIRGFRQELRFLGAFYATRSSRQQITVPLSEMETAIALHESTNNLTLNRAGVFCKQYTGVKDNKISISAMDVYFDPILQHWDRLEFLYHWQQAAKAEPSKLTIPTPALEAIHKKYTRFAPTPTLDTLVTSQALTLTDEIYTLNITGHPSINTDKIAGLLWEWLLQDNAITDDRSRLLSWLTKIPIDNHWPEHLPHVTFNAKTRFLGAAVNLLLHEADLAGVNAERAKLLLDSSHKHNATVISDRAKMAFEDYPLNNKDPFELYQGLWTLENRAHITYLHDQHARSQLNFLVHTIVCHEPETIEHGGSHTAPARSFPLIKTLLRSGLDRPFFIWSVAQAIKQRRPTALPALLTEPELAPLALAILDELEYAGDVESKLSEAWQLATNLLLSSLPTAAEHNTTCATILFQLFRQLNRDKYGANPIRPTSNRQKPSSHTPAQRRHQVLDLLENRQISKPPAGSTHTAYLLPVVFEPLSQCFLGFQEKPLYRNGTIQFPMLKWDGLFWLMKIATYWKYQHAFPDQAKIVRPLAQAFLQEYLATLEQAKIVLYDFFEEIEKTDIPHWSEKIERLQILDWIYPVFHLHKLGQLPEFLAPRITINPADDIYDKENNFVRDKLRTHLGVLLQVLRNLIMPEIPYGFEKQTLLAIKNKIEDQVINYLTLYSVDLPEDGRLDLFAYQKEWTLYQTDKEALLPQLAQSLNWFSQKADVIAALAATGDVIKLLILLDYVTVEGIRQALIEKIKSTDLQAFLEAKSWIPEIQTVLTKIAQYPELLPQLELAATYWRDEITAVRPQHQYKMQLFIAELLMAYFKKDGGAVNAVQEPDTPLAHPSNLSYHAHKQFYFGLLQIKDKPALTSELFDQLARQYPTYPTIALNRLVAKSNLAAQQNSRDIYRAALEEWNQHAANHLTPETLALLEPDITASLMTIHFALEEYQQIDDRFRALELPNQMTLAIIDVQVKSLSKQKKIAEALALIEKTKIYHQFAGFDHIQSLADLEIEVRGVDNIEDLKNQYHRIFGNTPARLVQILPPAFNGKDNIHDFLVKEFIHAADKMLGKIVSIEKLNDENKYNDIMELILDARLSLTGLHAAAQSRGGHSATARKTDGSQPGERDIPIVDTNQKIMLNCEAFIFRNATKTSEHLKKVFDYHHQRKAMIILVYDTATPKPGHQTNWDKYIGKILPKVVFPAGMPLQAPPTEITLEFGCDASAIKIAKTLHGTDTTIYHIFVNINYKLT